MKDEKIEIALDIVVDKIAELQEQYVFLKDLDKSEKIKVKLDVLEEIKDQLYSGNLLIAENVINKKEKGTL